MRRSGSKMSWKCMTTHSRPSSIGFPRARKRNRCAIFTCTISDLNKLLSKSSPNQVHSQLKGLPAQIQRVVACLATVPALMALSKIVNRLRSKEKKICLKQLRRQRGKKPLNSQNNNHSMSSWVRLTRMRDWASSSSCRNSSRNIILRVSSRLFWNCSKSKSKGRSYESS